MTGERVFSKLQWGLETDRGTAVAADTMVLAAPIPINPDRKPEFPTDQAGIRARSTRSHIYEYLVRNSLRFDADHPLYFQILPMIFECGLKGGVTPAEQTGSQSDYLWTHTPSLTAANTPKTITLEAGDDTQAYEVEHVQFERIRIGGEISQDGGPSPVSGDFDFYGRQWSTASFTGAISVPTTEIMNSAQARFFIDTTWAGVGGTEKTATLRSFDVEILTGLHPKFFGSANKYFSAYGEGYIDVMANFTLEGNATADAIWDAMNAQTLQVVRLTINGSQIGSGDTHALTLDIGGVWESVIPLSAEDKGNNIHAAVLHGKYDATGAKLLQVLTTTNVATV